MNLRVNTLLIIYSVLFLYSNAQSPLVKQWDKRFGGTGNEFTRARPLFNTTDSSFIIVGESKSVISGDKTQSNWGNLVSPLADEWMVQMDKNGNKLMDKRYGGVNEDGATNIFPIHNGYLIVGVSASGISGDRTLPSLSNNIADIWLIKINFNGVKIWDKVFGTAMGIGVWDAIQTKDGGFLLGTYTDNGISLDKTDTCRGMYDYWILKLDSTGVKQWDKTFGGSQNDELKRLIQTSDGGYMICGRSDSPISGDKTSDISGSAGLWDYWIVKTDSLGNKQWDKAYGGSISDSPSDIVACADGNYLIYGNSNSPDDGNKTAANHDSSASLLYRSDYWLVKIDINGTILWDKTYGGYDRDFGASSIMATADKGFIMAGISMSDIGGDKSENNLPSNYGQIWLVKIDSSGLLLWDKTANLVNGVQMGRSPRLGPAENNCFVLLLESNNPIGGEKTQANWDPFNSTSDYWIAKYCDTTLITTSHFLNANSQTISAYPNPFNSGLTLRFQGFVSQTSIKISIKNILGQQLYLTSIKSGSNYFTQTINTDFLTPGIYFITFKQDNKSWVRKVIKQ